jgi:hypothetical protein
MSWPGVYASVVRVQIPLVLLKLWGIGKAVDDLKGSCLLLQDDMGYVYEEISWTFTHSLTHMFALHTCVSKM